ncbi:MAG: glycerate kinase [Cyanophyceae cyanobacterium]
MTFKTQANKTQANFEPLVPLLEQGMRWRSLPSTAQNALQTRLTELTQAHCCEIAFCPQNPQDITGQVPQWLKLLETAATIFHRHPRLKALFRPSLRPQTLVTAWRLWIPWAIHLCQLREKFSGSRPLIQGVLGVQGTGKTTLGIVMEILAAALGRSLLNLSIDDFYLTYAQRQTLRQQDPRLIWRGPPGTHDIDLALQTLDQLARGHTAVPQFDKSLHGGQGDSAAPKPVESVDILWLEGWLVGCAPLDDAAFDGPLPLPIVTEGDRQFARDCNERLGAYSPLWRRLDQWAVLAPKDYRWSKRWRLQAEASRVAAGGKGLSVAEIGDFVDYFWRALHPDLFVTPWLTNGGACEGDSPNCVVEILGDRSVGQIQTPSQLPK